MITPSQSIHSHPISGLTSPKSSSRTAAVKGSRRGLATRLARGHIHPRRRPKMATLRNETGRQKRRPVWRWMERWAPVAAVPAALVLSFAATPELVVPCPSPGRSTRFSSKYCIFGGWGVGGCQGNLYVKHSTRQGCEAMQFFSRFRSLIFFSRLLIRLLTLLFYIIFIY